MKIQLQFRKISKNKSINEEKSMKIIAFHSYKGGTGKTHLSANLATVLARRGFKT
ncbi:MAG: ParA family protein, partial [Candidatus Hodarchaeales archaeon]